jgi:hypothetical protein
MGCFANRQLAARGIRDPTFLDLCKIAPEAAVGLLAQEGFAARAAHSFLRQKDLPKNFLRQSTLQLPTVEVLT